MAQSSFVGFSPKKKDSSSAKSKTLTAGNDISWQYGSNCSTPVVTNIPAKACQFKIPLSNLGSVRITFSLFSGSNTGTLNGQIYKNGAPVGTLRSYLASTAYASSPSYAEDIAVIGGDSVEIWIWGYIVVGVSLPKISATSDSRGFISGG